MTNAERCAECGSNLAMVGLRHRCIARPRERTDEAKAREVVAASGSREAKTTEADDQAGVGSERSSSRGTYKYRDADKWREHMKLYMRSYRARKKSPA